MEQEKTTGRKVWENLQYLNLALTIAGQILIGGSYMLGQSVWLVANIIALARDFTLQRPTADKVRDAAMTALTAGLMIFYLLGGYN